MRAGEHALSLLATPLNVNVVTALAEEPKGLSDLRRLVGSPPQTTMRKYMQRLTDAGVLDRRQEDGFPGRVEYELTGSGRQLVAVADSLQRWLDVSPDGSIALGSTTSKGVIKALVGGWSSAIVRALASKPFTLTELSRLIKGLNYPTLERRLAAMRFARQIEAAPNEDRGRPYAVTAWLRRGVAPVAMAARWEREHLREGSGVITNLDAEALFLLAVPMLDVDPEVEGTCRLVMEIGGQPAGVTVAVSEGRVCSCVSKLDGRAEASAVGSPSAWLTALTSGEVTQLDFEGDASLARELAERLHRTVEPPAAAAMLGA